MAKLDEETRQKLVEEHGDLAVVPTAAGDAAFKKPSRPQYRQFNSKIINEKTRADATEWLVRACVVFPSHDDFDQYLEGYPAIVGSCANAVIELAGGGEVETKNFVKGAATT